VRITIGTREQMGVAVQALKKTLDALAWKGTGND
jgi:histidinol-phosphate/aromatic aminotransferase/cobyric acid decarboxylase-like protein